MHKPIVRYSLSPNGNPWWVAFHMSTVSYEVQINKKTGNVLLGMGMAHTTNDIKSVEDMIEDSEVQASIVRNFNQETLDHILRICDETRTNREEVPAT